MPTRGRRIPNEIKVGCSPIGFVQCALLAAQASSFGRQIDGGKKVEDAHSLQSNEIGINPFTKEPCVFKAKLASKTVRALAMKKLKEALN